MVLTKVANVLLEDCSVRWSSGSGLELGGKAVSMRRCELSYNGFSGIGGGAVNLLMERVTTNFNGWRGYLGGRPGWSQAGVKLHHSNGHRILDHTAIGNLAPGFWYDIQCQNIFMDGGTMARNHGANLMWELSPGPFHGRRLVLVDGYANEGSALRFWNISRARVEDSLLWGDRAMTKDQDHSASLIHIFDYERDDSHAKLGKNLHQGFEFRRNRIGAVTTGGPLVLVKDDRDRFVEHYVPHHFKNEGNLYVSAAGDRPFAGIDLNRNPVRWTLAEWSKLPRVVESGATTKSTDHQAAMNPQAPRQWSMPQTMVDELKAFQRWVVYQKPE